LGDLSNQGMEASADYFWGARKGKTGPNYRNSLRRHSVEQNLRKQNLYQLWMRVLHSPSMPVMPLS